MYSVSLVQSTFDYRLNVTTPILILRFYYMFPLYLHAQMFPLMFHFGIGFT